MRNTVYPRRELIVRVEPVQVLVGFNQCILYDVICHGVIVAQVGDVTVQFCFVAQHYFGIGVNIARYRARND